MTNSQQIRIEPLGRQSQLYILVDRHGHSLGTGSRDVLEVLKYIAQQCDAANFYYGRRWGMAQQKFHHILEQYG